MTWTKPYYSVIHLGKITDRRWATINTIEYKAWYELLLWYSGCGFSPHQKHFDSLEEAKAEGERWIKEG